MPMSSIFIALALISVLWGIVSSMVVVSYLSARGLRINYVFLKVLVMKYMRQYHEITTREKGRPGPWFYSYVISMVLALGFAIAGLSLR